MQIKILNKSYYRQFFKEKGEIARDVGKTLEKNLS